MSDQWAWYRAALAGDKPAIADGIVRSGFFWTKASKAGGRIPVAIWCAADGTFQCRVGDKANARMVDHDIAAERWTFIAGNPVARDAYKIAYETGRWPDGTPAVAVDAATPAASAAKSNLPADPFARLMAEIDDKIASAETWIQAHPEAKSKTEADYATNLQREINALLKQADAMHGAEKAPLIAATKAVDDKFRFRDKMKSVGSALKSIFERFMVREEQKAKAAAHAKYEAERRATEIARAEMLKAQARRMADDPIAVLTDPAPELPELPLAPEPVKVQAGGGVGRAAGLKSVWVGTIEDQDAVYAHFRDVPAVREALQKLVDATVRTHKGATKINGASVKEERRAA